MGVPRGEALLCVLGLLVLLSPFPARLPAQAFEEISVWLGAGVSWGF